MSEQKPQYSSTEPDISKTKPSSGIQKSDHYGSMPDMSASGGLKPPELTRRESTVDPVDVSSDFSFIGSEPLFSSSPIPQDKKVFNFDLADNLQDQNSEQNMEETHQSDDKTMYHTAFSQVSEASLGSENASTESIPDRERRSISEHTKSKSSNLDQPMLRRASSGKLQETELNPLKTVDSVRQYFTKPSELLKRKLKHTSQENEQDLLNKKETVDFVKGKDHQSSPHQKPVPSQIKVVQCQEKVFKETVESKHKEHDTIGQEEAVKEDQVSEEFQKDAVDKLSIHKVSSDHLRIEPSPYTENMQKQTGGSERNDILPRSYSEPKGRQPVRYREERKYRSHDSHVGYDPHHDFTSVVDFLEVLKVQEEESRMTGIHVTDQREADEEEKEDSEHKTVEENMDDGQESVRTNDTGSVRSKVDFIESRKQKYTPVVPSPLTYIPSSNPLEKREESGEGRQIVHHDGEKGSRIGEVHVDVTGHGTNISGSTLSYTTPSKLLEKVEIREGRRSKEKFPGYGEIEYTTPSKLGMEKQDSTLSNTQASKLGMEKQDSTLSNTSPSELEVEKYESAMSYTTLSDQEIEKYESTLSYATPSMVGMERQDSIFSYTTPSKLLEKVEIREGRRRKEKFPGYGEIEYTTPSKLGMEKQDSTLSYTTPSKLLEKVEIREGRARSSKEKFPGYGEIEYTTPSKLGMEKRDSIFSYITPSELLEKVEIREVRRSKDKFPGYGEIEYSTPSKLGMEKQESTSSYTTPSRLGMERQAAAAASNLSYTTPSKLLEKVEIRERREKKGKFPGYGEMEYTAASQLGMIERKEQSVTEHNGHPTSTELLNQVETREVRRQSSPETLDNITPSELLEFNVQQEQERTSSSEGSASDTLSSEMYINMEENSGYGDSSISIHLELADLTPKPSNKRLAERPKKPEQMNSPNLTTVTGASCEENYKGSLHRVLSAPDGQLGYSLDNSEPSGKQEPSKVNRNIATTPSKLLEKVETRERREKKDKFPGYGVLDYTTPSKLGTKQKERVESDLFPTSSKLLEKVETREKRANREIFPGYGVLEYRTPSKLVTEPYKEKKTEEQPLLYTTPSELLENIRKRERREMSSGSGYSLLEYETKAKLAAEQNKTRSHKDLLHTTPSILMEKVELREKRRKKEEFPGYGVLDYRTPSSMNAEHAEESADNRPMIDQTPSTVLDEGQVREKRQPLPSVLDNTAPSKLVTKSIKEKIDDKGQILYTTPSKLLEKVEKREDRERRKEREFRYHDGRKSLHSDLSYTTPSKLLEKVEKREDRACRKDQPGYGTLDYTTPSKLIGLSQYQQDEERMASGTEVNRNGKRSLEQTECRSPTISELFEGVRQGNHGNRAPESTHYGSPTISELFEMVRQGNYGNRAPESTRYGSFSSTTPSIIAKKLGYGDSKTSFQQEEPSETANQSNKRLVDRPRNSGQAINKDQMVQSDTMMSAPTEDDSERLLHFHRIASAPNRLSNSQYDVNKSLNDSGLDTETSSITENDKSKDEKRSQREREAILSHIHSDITAYFSKQPSEEGYPNKRHRSEPEFFGSFCDFSSHPSLIDQDTDGAYNIKGTEPLLSSSSSSGGAMVPVDTSSGETTDAIVMDDIQYNEVQKYNGKVQNKLLFPKESDLSSSYPLSLDSLRYRESLSTFNPSYLTFGSNSFTEESTSSGKSSEESVIPMYKPVDDTASINQLFWSMYSSYPDLMQRFLNSDTGTPSQSALNSLSDLYSNALHSFTSDDHPNQEVHYSTGTQKKRALPQSPTSSAPDSRSFFMEKELMESQNRKLQLEISTLTTENKLFKDKYNRAAGKISDLEEELNETKSEYESLQQSVNEEVSEVQRKSKSQMAQDTDHLQSKVTSLVHENEQLKSEVMYLETQLQTANGVVEMARQNNDKNKTLEAYKMEVASLKDEVIKVKSLLEQSERHLHEEETRSRETSQQVIKLTEMKNLLQHQVDMSGGGNTVVDKQIKSLEKRLRVTEERLHQERSDRANNLSAVEDKLLTENARLQATEKELSRQLQREKDKNCNLEQKTKDVKNENEKLRLQVPFDETSLTSHKYDIPYSTHSSQRHESAKNHDFKHIASQLEQQAGVKSEIDMICHLWTTREQAYNQLRHLELMLQDLNLRDNDVTEGLKIQELESKVQSLTRSNQMSEGEITTLKVQMEAREKTLRDVESELELANSKMDLDNGEERKQQKIDKLTAQVNSKQAELGLMNDKYNRLLAENRSLEMELDITKLDLTSVKTKQKEITGIADTKMSFSVKEELEDKSRQIEKMAEEIEKLDSALQQTRQDLYQEQLQCNDLEGQVEGMQQEFEERGRIIDAISETEKEQLSQYKILKNTLDSVNADLKKKEGKIKIQEVELSQQIDKIQQLERKLSLHNETTGGVMVPESAVTELERDKIKSELLEAYSKIKTTEEEMLEMASELQQIQEELTNQKAELLQLSSEKGELEQHLEEIAEEHDALIQEKAQSEEDIVKLENKLQELVETLEIEARKQHGNFGNQYENIPAEFSQMAEELGTLRSLLESKDKELEMFQTKASRQQMDLEFLQRRIELLHSDNQSNREDIARMTNQLILKIKEGVESRQLNEYLSGERVKQQNELAQLEQNLERTAQLQVVKQTEIEKSEFSKKDATISVLEKSSEQVRKALQDNEYENVQLRYRIETLTNDQRKLSTINSSLETKLEMEKKMYDESHQEVTSLNHKLDLLQREHDHVLNNLNTEKQLKEKLNVMALYRCAHVVCCSDRCFVCTNVKIVH
ncbi:golgin subfamily B member 1 [Mytilus galloprovincialis]|uniref:Golgin subfamily B member 1 n=1 Tax=Mytilus galloprovincialis TaxID=29158 RepID=A0A8B6EGW5_MYTGA|nr:golgin subfamily B member 1 [Mytilus galloprovincialis]